jgi:hypothetical protein
VYHRFLEPLPDDLSKTKDDYFDEVITLDDLKEVMSLANDLLVGPRLNLLRRKINVPKS